MSPPGKSWDHETLKEFTDALGTEAPAWAKKRLADTDEDTPTSTERLVSLAEKEKFMVAHFFPYWQPGRPLEIDFTGFSAEDFDNVAFVTD